MELIFSLLALAAALSALYLARKNKAALVCLAGAVSVLAGCGPINRPPTNHYIVVFHNQGHFAQDITIRVASGGVYIGEEKRKVPPNTDASFTFGESLPDLVEVDAGWGSVAWSGPEIAGFWVFHVCFPSGSTWKEIQVR